MERVDFGILGPLEARRDGRLVDLGGPKPRAVLAVLLLHSRQVVPADRLVDELWGEAPPPQAAATLRAYVSNLRRALDRRPPVVLVTRAPGYLLDLDHDRLDARRFERLAHDAHAALGASDPDRAAQLVGDALALWRGPALADFADEPFARAEAARLEELRLVALEDQVEAALALGRHGPAVADLEPLVAAHPLRERFHGQLMLALYRSGRQADALAAYRRLRRALVEELGLDPGPALRRLEAAILDQAPELDWRPPAPAASPAARTGTPGPKLVGRAAELQVLAEALAGAAAGSGCAVLVAGEAGIGKTRLLEELAARAQARGAGVLWGRCQEGAARPAFEPWAQVLRPLVREAAPAELREAIAGGAAELAQVVPEVRAAAPDPGPPAADPATARSRLADAVTHLLVRQAERRPLAVVIDDLQWADAASLELLASLASHLRVSRVLVAGAYRSTPAPLAPPLSDLLGRLAREAATVRVELAGLQPAETAEMLALATGSRPAPATVTEVHRRSGGNPFFVTELARPSANAGAAATVPAAVRDVLRARLHQLSPAARALVLAAAVVGPEFDLALPARLASLDGDAALEAAEAALGAGFLVEEAGARHDLRFSHDLVREAVYGELSGLRRARLHRRVAELLEQAPGAEARVTEIAHHYSAGLAAGCGPQAVAASLRAADAATTGLAYEQAEQQLHRALRALPRLDAGERDRAELQAQVRLGNLLMLTQGYGAPGVGAACERARDLSRAVQGRAEEAVPALWRLSAFYVVRADFDAAGQLGRQLLELGRQTGHPAALAAGHQTMAVVHLHTGRPGAARDHLAQASDAPAGLGDPLLVATMPHHPDVIVAAFSAWARWLLGEGAAARAVTAAAVDRARNRPDPSTLAFALFFDAWLAAFEGDVPRARAAAGEAVELCAERGFRLFGAMCTVLRAWGLAHEGDPGAGVAGIRDGLVAIEATGARMLRPYFLATLGAALLLDGRPAEAEGALEHGLAESRRSGDRFWDAELHRLRGEALAAGSRWAEAEAALGEALAVARGQGARALEQRAAASMAGLARTHRSPA